MSVPENIGEEGGEQEIDLLKVHEPSFFATPWDPPKTDDVVKVERPKVLTVVTKQKLTEPQRVFIRTDASVRANRIWKAKYDSYNGKHIIDGLKDAIVSPLPAETTTKALQNVRAEIEGEGEGENMERKLGEQLEGFDETDVEILGEDLMMDNRDTVQKILDALKEALTSHNETWKLKEMQKLCTEYTAKAMAIIEKKRDWKLRVVKLQMHLADQVTEELCRIQSDLVRIKEKIEDSEMIKALRRHERELEEAIVYWNEKKLKALADKKAAKENELAFTEVEGEEQFMDEFGEEQYSKRDILGRDYDEEMVGEELQAEDDSKQEVADDKFYSVVPFNELPEKLKQTLANRGHVIDNVVVTNYYPEDELTEASRSGRYLMGTSQRSMNAEEERNEVRSTEAITSGLWSELKIPSVKKVSKLEIEYSPVTFELKNPAEQGDGNQTEVSPTLKPIGLSLPPLDCRRFDVKGNTHYEIPLYVAVEEEIPTKKMIATNLTNALALAEKTPNSNPFELALDKSIGQVLYRRLQRSRHGSKQDPDFALQMANDDLTDYGLCNLSHCSRDQLPFAYLYNWMKGKCKENPTFYGHSELGCINFTSLLTDDSRNRQKFARVGVLKITQGRAEFLPDLKNFDSKTRAIYARGNRRQMRKLPLTTLRVVHMEILPCAIKSHHGIVDGHVSFRGVMKKLVGKSPLRIFIENRMTAEEYQNRYKGREWLQKKLNALYDEFVQVKNDIIKSGLEGRLVSERREDDKDCCPIFWDLAYYIRSAFDPKELSGHPLSADGFPTNLKQLKQLFSERILAERPELRENSIRLEAVLCEWGGRRSCKADLNSILDLIERLGQIDELKPLWNRMKQFSSKMTSCPLCVLFKFLAGSEDARRSYISQKDGYFSKKATYGPSLDKELLTVEAIVEKFMNIETAPVDPTLLPERDLFHIITTIEAKKQSKTFRLGFDKISTRNFVMRSCAIVIFDITRSDDEIPLAWCFLKQHIELLDRRDVRDISDEMPTRHLILITNFLSWAKSPKPIKSNMSEKTFYQRVPHPDYVENYKLENAVYFTGLNHAKFNLRTTIIYSGIPFGEGEDVFAYLFKMAWDNELELPLFGNGKNVLPLIHINDLKWIVSKTVSEKTYPPIIFAMNKNDLTVLDQMTKMAAELGSTKVVKFPSPNFKMKHCITKIVDDLLKLDVRHNYVESPEHFGASWNNAFSKKNKLRRMINELRENRRLYGKTVFLVGPPSKAKSELAIIISKLYSLPLIHKGNILNYFLRATQENEPMRGEDEGEDDAPEEEEKEPEPEDDDEDGEKKARKFSNPLDRDVKNFKLIKKLIDSKAANNDRKHLTKLLQRLLQSVFIQSHGYVLVDWPVRKEDAIALFTKVLDDAPPDEESIEEKPKRRPPARPEFTIHVNASELRLDEENYLLFQENNLRTSEDLRKDFIEYQYFRRIHKSVVDLFEERNERMYRFNSNDGYKAVSKVLSVLSMPQQDSGREMVKMFLRNEKTCSKDAQFLENKAKNDESWLRNVYTDAINGMLSIKHDRQYSLREELLGNPLETFKNEMRFPTNVRKLMDENYEPMRNIDPRLADEWPLRSRVWNQIENRRVAANFQKAKQIWKS